MNEHDSQLSMKDWAKLSVPILKHIEDILSEKEKALNIRFSNIETAVTVTRDTVNDKFGTVNEWRITYGDLAATKVDIKALETLRDVVNALINKAATKDELIAFQKTVEPNLREFRDFQVAVTGKASQQAVDDLKLSAGGARQLATIAILLSALLGVLSLVMTGIGILTR